MKNLSKTEITVDDKIKLVAPRLEQIEELVNIFQNLENLDFIGEFPDWPHDPNLKDRLNDWIEKSKEGKFLALLITHEEQVAGICRLIDINYAHEKVEFGYILLPKFTKKGIATRAVRAMLNFSFNNLKLNRVELIIDSKNEDSINLARRLNFVHEGTLRQDYKYKYSKPGEFSNGEIWSMLKEEHKR